MARRKRRKNPPLAKVARIAMKLREMQRDVEEMLEESETLVIHAKMGLKMLRQLLKKAVTIASNVAEL